MYKEKLQKRETTRKRDTKKVCIFYIAGKESKGDRGKEVRPVVSDHGTQGRTQHRPLEIKAKTAGTHRKYDSIQRTLGVQQLQRVRRRYTIIKAISDGMQQYN